MAEQIGLRVQETLAALEAFRQREVMPIEDRIQTSLDGRAPVGEDGRLRPEVLDARSEVRQRSAAHGFYTLHLPEEMGGGGYSLEEMFYIQEAVYRRGLGLFKDALAWTEGPAPVLRHATADQRARLLEPVLRGKQTMCFALTEPDVGSDFLSMGTVATREGTGWRIRGAKALITWAPFADLALVVARTGEPGDHGSLTAFLVPRATPGFTFLRMHRTLNDDGVTGEIALRDCLVPDDQRLGEVGQGFSIALGWINWRRTCRGGQAAGLGGLLLDRTIAYVQGRRTFGAPLGSRQSIQFLVADMHLDWEAARAYSLSCLRQLDGFDIWRQMRLPKDAVRLISSVKVWNDEALYRIADRAVQAHGGWGLASETGIEQIFRVARNLRIPAGTDEIQRLTIARALGLEG